MELGNWSIKNQLGSTNSKGLPVLFQGSHQGFLLNNHYVYPSAVSRRLSVVVYHGIHEDAKPGNNHHQPVSIHEAAFRAPSPHLPSTPPTCTAHRSSPMVDPHSSPIPIHRLPLDPNSKSCHRAPTSTLKGSLETSARPPICQPCHNPLQASSATSLHRECL